MAAKKQVKKAERPAVKRGRKRAPAGTVDSGAKKRAKSTVSKRAKKAPPKKAARPSGRARQAVVKAVSAGMDKNGGPLANPLENPRYEQFCQLVHSGVIPRMAAIRVGLSEKTASTQAWRLLKYVEIQRRLAWLHTQSANRLIARKRDVLVAHSADALVGPADFANLIGMDRDQARDFLASHPYGHVVREIEIENVAAAEQAEPGGPVVNRIESRVKRFKLADSMAARRELAKLLDWYAPHPVGMRRRGAVPEADGGAADLVRVVCVGPGEGDEQGEADEAVAVDAGMGRSGDRLGLPAHDERSGRRGRKQDGSGPVVMGTR